MAVDESGSKRLHIKPIGSALFILLLRHQQSATNQRAITALTVRSGNIGPIKKSMASNGSKPT
ncbi:hypothetical protein ACLOJK_018867 [Asimina triloba]